MLYDVIICHIKYERGNFIMKKGKFIIVFIIILLVLILGCLFLVFRNKLEITSSNPMTLSNNLKNFETEYHKIAMIPEQKAFIKIEDKIYKCFDMIFKDTEINQMTETQIKDIPTIKSSDNTSIIRRNTEQISISPIIDLGNEVEAITTIISQGDTSYLRAFPRIYLETTVIESNISEAQIPNNLPTGIYKTTSGNSTFGLFYYQQENEEISKDFLKVYEQYKQQELELLKYKNLAEKKINDNFGYLNLLMPKGTEIYQIANYQITGKQTTTKQEVEANFSYGNVNLPSSNIDILYYNGKLYYSIRVGGGNILKLNSHWSDIVAVSYDTLKQMIEKGLENNIEHNIHKTQKQSSVYSF